MLNSVSLVGRLVRDPELQHTGTGTPVSTICVAVERSYVPQGSERETDFIDVVLWRKTAEFVCKYFRKGNTIAVDGKIQTRSYMDKNGINHKVYEVSADEVSFCGNKSGEKKTSIEEDLPF